MFKDYWGRTLVLVIITFVFLMAQKSFVSHLVDYQSVSFLAYAFLMLFIAVDMFLIIFAFDNLKGIFGWFFERYKRSDGD